ncbi:phosphatase PAP2 family protein [Phytoactinopolyspora halotolerans]|uniref:Phosphatase PAP2 family protein n=1 Tax=Phytoactinopolyspora halotolerans TaxID=1981512 RepID=A0A6L9S6G7_9ACTN|nr:phosphatase PAP2 family protein [Phytoactinopolyspora halotolerans]NEE00351.1 phosphatase PAP2 family protein [Phytoactinopolyspora halotolerans]
MRARVLERVRNATHDGRAQRVVREVVLILTAALLYSLVRGMTDDRVGLAFDNAERLISFQQSIGLFVEPDIQSWVVGHDAVINVINAIYIAGYWPVLVGTLVWLLLRHPDRYPLYRNALLASGAITLVIFALFPLAPPRFLPEYGFVDTVSDNSSAYRDFSASPFVNEYAAMPSLHFGWILLLGIAWTTVGRSAMAKVFGATMPVLMFLAIVLTGNHYILDGIVGGTVVLLGLVVAVGVEHVKAVRSGAHAEHAPLPVGRQRSNQDGPAFASEDDGADAIGRARDDRRESADRVSVDRVSVDR